MLTLRLNEALKKDSRTAIVLDDVRNHHIDDLKVEEPENEKKDNVFERE